MSSTCLSKWSTTRRSWSRRMPEKNHYTDWHCTPSCSTHFISFTAKVFMIHYHKTLNSSHNFSIPWTEVLLCTHLPHPLATHYWVGDNILSTQWTSPLTTFPFTSIIYTTNHHFSFPKMHSQTHSFHPSCDFLYFSSTSSSLSAISTRSPAHNNF